MSPEQLRGLKHVDHRGDLYAVGMTMYHLLVGRVPFDPEESIFTIYKKIEAGSFPSITHYAPYLPTPLVKIVSKALRLNPEDRFQSAGEMLQTLKVYQETGESVLNENDSWVAPASKTFAHNRRWIYGAGSLLIVAGLYAAFLFTSRPPEDVASNILVSALDSTSSTRISEEPASPEDTCGCRHFTS